MPVLIPPMYNLWRSVGRNGENLRTDVMLIQYFLFSINFNSGWNTSGIINNSAGPGGGAVVFPHDGVYRSDLAVWIENFQKEANKGEFGPVVVDGRVDPVKVGWGNKRINVPNKRTIQAFNQVMWRSNRDRFMDLSNDQSVPAALRADLSTIRMEI